MPSVEEKSLMLADSVPSIKIQWPHWKPYSTCTHGSAQFDAILLDHLQKNASENAITRIANKNFSIAMTLNVDDFCSLNQANILDEILRMDGKM